MLEVYSQGNKIVIDSTQRQSYNENRDFREEKVLLVNDYKVFIDRDSVAGTIFSRLPHTSETDMLLVDLRDYKGNISFDVFCNEDEYFFAIEYNYFKIWNELNRLRELEQLEESEGWLIEWTSNNDTLDKAKAQLISNINPKIQLFKHVSYDTKYLNAKLSSREVNLLNSYSNQERRKLKNIMKPVTELRLWYLLSHDIDLNSNSKKFYIIKGKLEKSLENNSGLNHGQLLESMQNYDIADKPIAVIVHGVASSCVLDDREVYSDLVSFLVPNFHVFTYDYLTINQSIDDSGAILAEKIRTLKRISSDNKKVFVIAHSMGGLVSRAALVVHGAPIDSLIMAGTPNNGSKLGSLKGIASKILLKANKDRLKLKDTQNLLHGKLKGLEDLGNKTGYIKTLNACDLGNENKYYSIVGNFLGLRNDIIVSNFNMTRINGNSLPHFHKANLHHMNYFSYKNIKKSVGKALENI